jgi:hypothetical protein
MAGLEVVQCWLAGVRRGLRLSEGNSLLGNTTLLLHNTYPCKNMHRRQLSSTECCVIDQEERSKQRRAKGAIEEREFEVLPVESQNVSCAVELWPRQCGQFAPPHNI